MGQRWPTLGRRQNHRWDRHDQRWSQMTSQYGGINRKDSNCLKEEAKELRFILLHISSKPHAPHKLRTSWNSNNWRINMKSNGSERNYSWDRIKSTPLLRLHLRSPMIMAIPSMSFERGSNTWKLRILEQGLKLRFYLCYWPLQAFSALLVTLSQFDISINICFYQW